MATFSPRQTRSGRRWCAIIRLKGRPSESKTFRTKAMAQRWAAKRETELREGRHLHRREAERRTFAELVNVYVNEIAPHSGRVKNVKGQASQLRWWQKHMGDCRLCDITPALIADGKRRLLDARTRRGRRRSPGTVNRYLAALSRVLTVAVKELGWLESNPARRVERLPEPRGRVRYLAEDEKDRLLQACREHPNPRLQPLVALALGTGGRRGELLGLRWADVSLRPGQEMVTFRDTKNGETRSVALAGMALSAIHELRALRQLGSNLLFPTSPGRRRPATLRSEFDTAARNAGLEDFRFHDLRHTFASYLAMSGATLGRDRRGPGAQDPRDGEALRPPEPAAHPRRGHPDAREVPRLGVSCGSCRGPRKAGLPAAPWKSLRDSHRHHSSGGWRGVR